ncbi:hypothetical protein ALC57_00788 [Trachymyrmex cornetzi]|uniref:Uncharacterized protein n=1 Tax=Trachymyrmex cornetzi TaxID=471704 RepID=A0A151JQY7_9HYME|nr:hypothetical protein ALC57_00788 [Trachymyrmex cornetzi]
MEPLGTLDGRTYIRSPRLASPHLATPHLATPHLTSPHLTSPHLTSPHLTSPHLVSPRLALPHARTPLRSRSQSARSTFFLHVLFPRLYPVSRMKPIGVGSHESYRLVVQRKSRFASVRDNTKFDVVALCYAYVSFHFVLRPVPIFCNF